MKHESLMSPEAVAAGRRPLTELRDGLARVLFGQDELLDLTVVALAARGHLLLEGLPGLGKTELVKSLATLLELDFARVQFTPDLLPSDITGGPVLQEQNGHREFVFEHGPLFANVVLADEINRASPKTQSALLEAMQERQVTVLGKTHELPRPFFVLATQNPIELEGTYPLPEAQLDRFLFKVNVPSVGAEVLTRILMERRGRTRPTLEPVLNAGELEALFAAVDRVFLPQAMADWIARLTEATDPTSPACPESVRPSLRYGASPRAAIAMAESARAAALLAGRPNVDFADVERVATAALGHRIVLEHTARLEGRTPADVVASLLSEVRAVGSALPGGLR